MDLDPQLRDYLDKANMLKSMENVSEIPVQQLRQMYAKPYRWNHYSCCHWYTHAKIVDDVYDTCMGGFIWHICSW